MCLLELKQKILILRNRPSMNQNIRSATPFLTLFGAIFNGFTSLFKSKEKLYSFNMSLWNGLKLNKQSRFTNDFKNTRFVPKDLCKSIFFRYALILYNIWYIISRINIFKFLIIFVISLYLKINQTMQPHQNSCSVLFTPLPALVWCKYTQL